MALPSPSALFCGADNRAVMVGADHFRRRVYAIYVAGWATCPVNVVTPGAVILVEARAREYGIQ